jgi:NAD(P)-dependent dehydrogenase (short-subunit alcohol dehydrogenase family)
VLPDLSGRVVIVTGASTGIGLGIAQAIVEAGGSVVMCARDSGRLLAAAQELSGVESLGAGDESNHRSRRVLAVRCDVTDETEVANLIRASLDRFGHLSGCVANVGIDDATPLHEMSLDVWRRVMTANLDSAFLTARETVRALLDAGSGGSIVTIGSMAANRGRPGRAHYVASKAALIGLTRTIAAEYGGHGIRANVVLPGAVETDMIRNSADAEGIRERISKQTPLGRPGQVGDLGGVVTYLLSDLADYHTGDVISVDGGLSIV